MANHGEVVARVTHAFAAANRDPERLLEIIATQLAVTIGDSCSVLVLEEDRTLHPAAHHDPDPELARVTQEAHGEPMHLDQHPLLRRIVESREPFMTELPPEAMRPPQTTQAWAAYAQHIGLHGILIVPLLVRSGVAGLLSIARHRATPRPFDSDDLALAVMLGANASLALDNARTYTTLTAARRQERELFESSPVAKCAVDRETHRIVAANRAALALYGYTRQEMIGLHVDALRATSALPVPSVLEELRGTVVHRRARHRRRDGSEIDVETTSYEATYDGKPVLLGVLTEATDAATAVREWHRAESRFARLAEMGLVGIIVADPAGQIREANGAVARLLGRAESQLRAMNMPDVVAAPWRVAHQEILDTLEATGAQPPRELELVRADGSSAPVLLGAARLDGEVTYFVLDVSSTAWASSAMEHLRDARIAQERMERVNKELETFSYSVAHDVRAPLRAISGFATLLFESHSDRLDEEGRDWLQEIVTNVRKLGELVDALLTMSRLTRGELEIERVDVGALAREVARGLAKSAPAHHVELVTSDAGEVEADPKLLRIILENLLGNGWKFTRDAQAPRVDVGVDQRENGERVVYVRDNGAGFDMQYAGKLFTPFQRLHKSFEYPGTGIGLATVQRIVHRHGGRIWAAAAPGAGATFFFTLAATAP